MSLSPETSPRPMRLIPKKVNSNNTNNNGSSNGGGPSSLSRFFLKDGDVSVCSNKDCGAKFGLVTRQHACRMCCQLFCSKCLHRVGSNKKVKVCGQCRIPKLLQLEATAMRRIFDYLPVRSHAYVMMTCKTMQSTLPLTDLEYKSIEQWNFARRVQIGRGGCGTVFRCEQDDGTKLAVKIIPKVSVTNMYVWKKVLGEIEIMRKLDHPSIIKLVDAFQTRNEVVIVTDYAEGGTLRTAVDYVRKNDLDIEKFSSHVCSQLCQALHYLWSEHGIAHRDLKLENVVVSRDFSRVCLIDFGLAEYTLPPSSSCVTATAAETSSGGADSIVKKYVPCGTVGYASPENIFAVFARPSVLMASSLTMHKSDMYSLGVMLWYMLTGTKLFMDTNFRRIKAQMDMGVQCEGSAWRHVSDKAKEATASLLQRSTARRPTAAEYLRQPWVVMGSVDFTVQVQDKLRRELEEQNNLNVDDEWVFIQYGGYVESSWVLLDGDATYAMTEAMVDRV